MENQVEVAVVETAVPVQDVVIKEETTPGVSLG
jgi:hypothetical protein